MMAGAVILERKREMKKIFSYLLAGLLMFSLCACGNKPEKQIVGRWEQISHESEGNNWSTNYERNHFFRILEFYDDGTLLWDSNKSENFATWNITGDNKIKVEYNDTLNSSYSGIEIYIIESIDNNQLILSDDTGATATYQKSQE